MIQKTIGGRLANQVAIGRRQMRPSNRHIASMAAMIDDHPDTITRQEQQHRQELAPN